MMRYAILLALFMAAPLHAQTIGVFPAGTRDPNAAVPLNAFTVTAKCDNPKAPDTVGLTDRPDTVSWDAPNKALDCLASLAGTPIASLPPRQPNGYQAAVKVGATFGPLSHAFLAPAQVTVPTIEALTAFRVQAPHPCTKAVAYRLYIDNAKVGNDLPPSACVSGTVTAASAGVSAGSHTIEISAVDPVSEKRGAPTTIQANAPQTVAPGPATAVQP